MNPTHVFKDDLVSYEFESLVHEVFVSDFSHKVLRRLFHFIAKNVVEFAKEGSTDVLFSAFVAAENYAFDMATGTIQENKISVAFDLMLKYIRYLQGVCKNGTYHPAHGVVDKKTAPPIEVHRLLRVEFISEKVVVCYDIEELRKLNPLVTDTPKVILFNFGHDIMKMRGTDASAILHQKYTDIGLTSVDGVAVVQNNAYEVPKDALEYVLISTDAFLQRALDETDPVRVELYLTDALQNIPFGALTEPHNSALLVRAVAKTSYQFMASIRAITEKSQSRKESVHVFKFNNRTKSPDAANFYLAQLALANVNDASLEEFRNSTSWARAVELARPIAAFSEISLKDPEKRKRGRPPAQKKAASPASKKVTSLAPKEVTSPAPNTLYSSDDESIIDEESSLDDDSDVNMFDAKDAPDPPSHVEMLAEVAVANEASASSDSVESSRESSTVTREQQLGGPDFMDIQLPPFPVVRVTTSRTKEVETATIPSTEFSVPGGTDDPLTSFVRPINGVYDAKTLEQLRSATWNADVHERESRLDVAPRSPMMVYPTAFSTVRGSKLYSENDNNVRALITNGETVRGQAFHSDSYDDESYYTLLVALDNYEEGCPLTEFEVSDGSVIAVRLMANQGVLFSDRVVHRGGAGTTRRPLTVYQRFTKLDIDPNTHNSAPSDDSDDSSFELGKGSSKKSVAPWGIDGAVAKAAYAQQHSSTEDSESSREPSTINSESFHEVHMDSGVAKFLGSPRFDPIGVLNLRTRVSDKVTFAHVQHMFDDMWESRKFKRSTVVIDGEEVIDTSRKSYSVNPPASRDLDTLIAKIATTLFGDDIPDNVEAQFLYYETGGQFEQHHDSTTIDVDGNPDEETTSDAPIRAVTVLIYLNDVEEGGETVFPLVSDDQFRQGVTPKEGTAVVFKNMYPPGNTKKFRSDVIHYANPVTSGTKKAVNLWFYSHA